VQVDDDVLVEVGMGVGPVGFGVEQQDLLWGMWRGGESLRTMERALAKGWSSRRTAARRSTAAQPSQHRGGRTTAGREQAAAVRDWARSNGYEVSDLSATRPNNEKRAAAQATPSGPGLHEAWCRRSPERIDPLQTVGITPERPMPYWGWGVIPDQYGRTWDGDDGETPPPPDPQLADLPALHPGWGPRHR